MANYVKATNFYTKDALLTGNPDKIIKGSEIDAEYNAIATAIGSKADTTSPTFTGTPLTPTAAPSNNTQQIASTAFVSSAISSSLANVYPIGSIYINASESSNPFLLFGFGTWIAFGEGKVLIGVGSGFTAGTTGGTADAVVVSHSHTATSTVTDNGHTHTGPQGANSGTSDGINITSGNPLGNTIVTASATTGISVATSIATVGVSGTNANLPPYIVVYMWIRTA